MTRNEEEKNLRGNTEEEKDEVEAHSKKAMTDEPKADDESSDDFEAHSRRA